VRFRVGEIFMLSLIISTIVFFVASWYIKRYLDEQEIPKGMTRGVLIFTLSASASWGAAALVDWAQVNIAGPQAASQTSGDLSKLLKGTVKPHP
jgi:hypothetical protein